MLAVEFDQRRLKCATAPQPRKRVLGLLFVAALAACRSTPPPVIPPPPLQLPPDLTLTRRAFRGTALGGDAITQNANTDALFEALIGVRLHALYVTSTPRALTTDAALAFQPLVNTFNLALELGDRPGIVASPRLFQGARIAAGPETAAWFAELASRPAAEVARIDELTFAVGPELAFELSAQTRDTVPDAENFLGEFARRPPIPMGFRYGFDGEGGLSWTLTLEAALAQSRSIVTLPDEERFRPGSPAPAQQLLRPSLLPEPGAPVVVLLPTPFVETRGQTLALLVEVLDEVDDATLATTRALYEREAAKRAASVQGTGDRAAEQRAVAEATERIAQLLKEDADLRQALLFLVELLQVPTAADIVLALRERELKAIAGWLLEDMASGRRDAAWALEVQAWRALAITTRGDRFLPPVEPEGGLPPFEPRTAGQRAALEGVLLRHAGEVGRYPRLVETLVMASVDHADFELRLIAENRAFLQDSNPAARVRAFDWLVARKQAPPGFGPLASAVERRAALEAPVETEAAAEEAP